MKLNFHNVNFGWTIDQTKRSLLDLDLPLDTSFELRQLRLSITRKLSY